RRPGAAIVAKRQVTPQKQISRTGEGIAQDFEERGIAVAAGAVGKYQRVAIRNSGLVDISLNVYRARLFSNRGNLTGHDVRIRYVRKSTSIVSMTYSVYSGRRAPRYDLLSGSDHRSRGKKGKFPLDVSGKQCHD